ncbi:hypothetical protein M0802_004939 [Mischocyttarus mexicanus]|nr:hypothetical protein M0802_004939 [Mischocyttarus mexicanus]
MEKHRNDSTSSDNRQAQLRVTEQSFRKRSSSSLLPSEGRKRDERYNWVAAFSNFGLKGKMVQENQTTRRRPKDRGLRGLVGGFSVSVERTWSVYSTALG